MELYYSTADVRLTVSVSIGHAHFPVDKGKSSQKLLHFKCFMIEYTRACFNTSILFVSEAIGPKFNVEVVIPITRPIGMDLTPPPSPL